MRKTSSDFGWDWGPAYIPAGIIGPVTLIKSGLGVLDSVLLDQTTSPRSVSGPSSRQRSLLI